MSNAEQLRRSEQIAGTESSTGFMDELEKFQKREERLSNVDTFLVEVKLDHFPKERFARDKKVMKVFQETHASKAKKEVPAGHAEGINVISRVKFTTEGGKTETGWMKEEVGEAYFAKDGTKKRWDFRKGAYEVADPEIDKDLQRLMEVWSSDSFRTGFEAEWAKEHGVTPEEARAALASTFDEEVFCARMDVNPRSMAAREAVMYRMGLLTGLANVPPTVERIQSKMVEDEVIGSHIAYTSASIQEQVPSSSSDPEKAARNLSVEEMKVLLTVDESQWGEVIPGMNMETFKNRMTELACMDWLMGSLDRHEGNFFIDPVSGEVTAIDNGLHSGRGRKADGSIIRMPGSEGKKKTMSSDQTLGMRQLRSVPLEILANNSGMRLSDEKRQNLQNLYDRIYSNDELIPGSNTGSAEKLAIEKQFQILFPDSAKEAGHQMMGYISRLKTLIDTGRPPEAFKKDLFPIGLFTVQMEQSGQS